MRYFPKRFHKEISKYRDLMAQRGVGILRICEAIDDAYSLLGLIHKGRNALEKELVTNPHEDLRGRDLGRYLLRQIEFKIRGYDGTERSMG